MRVCAFGSDSPLPRSSSQQLQCSSSSSRHHGGVASAAPPAWHPTDAAAAAFAFARVPHDQQIPGLGLQAAVQQLQRAVASAQGQRDDESSRRHDDTTQRRRTPGLLPKPLPGPVLLQPQQQHHQQQPQELPAASEAQAPWQGRHHHQQQQQPAAGALQQQQEVHDAIAAATTLMQLQQLLPGVAAAPARGQPTLLAVLLLQAVRVSRSSSSGSSSNEAAQLLQGAGLLLQRQCDSLQLQHLSAVLWAWSQFGWRPAQGVAPGMGLRDALQRLLRCSADRELAGADPSAGPVLSRLVLGCARLNIQNPAVWARACSMIRASARVLGPADASLCAWALARSRALARDEAQGSAVFGALLARADSLGAASFGRVQALNLLWAVVQARMCHLAPLGLMRGLLDQAVGHSFLAWQQQQQQCAGAAAAAGVPCDLLPAEVTGLVWTLAGAQQQRRRVSASLARQQQLQKQEALWQPGAAAASGGPSHPPGQQQPHQLDAALADLCQEPQLQRYLRQAVTGQLQQQRLQPRQLATLAQAFAQQAAHAGAAEDVRASTQQLVLQLWAAALQHTPCTAQLPVVLVGFSFAEVSMLLHSVVELLRPPQQRQQLTASTAAEVRGQVVSAALQHIATAAQEPPPVAAAVLLHHLGQLQRCNALAACADGSSSSSGAADAAIGRLASVLSTSRAVSKLRDRELVLAAVAAGQLLASPVAAVTQADGSSSSRPALQRLLQQLALPLAAVAHELKLRSLANVSCAYAAAADAQPPLPELFDAIAEAVTSSEPLLQRGSSWSLVRILGAFAAAEYVAEDLFAAVADALLPRLRGGVLHARVLATYARALAAAGWHDPEAFRDIAAVVVAGSGGGRARPAAAASAAGGASAAALLQQQQHGEALKFFTPRDVSTLAWALGTAGYRGDAAPYQALAAAGLKQLPGFSLPQLADLLWGLAAAGVYSEPLVAGVTQLLLQPAALAPAAAAADVATLAWSLSELRAAHPAVLAACAAHFAAHQQQYSAGDAADLAWALAVAAPAGAAEGWCAVPSALLHHLMRLSASDTEALSPQQLANLCLVAALAHSGSSDRSDVSERLWSAVAAWGTSAFTAADGAKLLLAYLLPPSPQQQQQQAGAVTAAAAASSKLLAAGARYLARHAAAVAATPFCQQVLSALQELGLAAAPASQAAPPAAAAEAARAAAAAVARAAASPSAWPCIGPAEAGCLLGHIVVHGTHHCKPVLLQLVPAGELCRLQQQSVAWRAAAAAAVLQGQQQQQPHFAGVVLTQQQWERWGGDGQQPEQLAALLTAEA